MSKPCTRADCEFQGSQQSLSMFHKSKATKDGHVSQCKSCQKRLSFHHNHLKKRDVLTSKVCNVENCPYLGMSQPIVQFHKCGTGYGSSCKSCKTRTGKKLRAKALGIVAQAKKAAGNKCATCDNTTPEWILVFAHHTRNDKLAGLSTLIKEDDIKQELEKGRFTCLLCHCKETEMERKSTASQHPRAIESRKRRAPFLAFVNTQKVRAGQCGQCSLSVDPTDRQIPLSYFQWDHLPGTDKIDAVSNLALNCEDITTVIGPEIDKCQLLCEQCHRSITIQRRKEMLAQR